MGSTSGPAVTTATGATVAGVSSSGSTLAAATSNSSITGAAGNSVGAGKSWSSVTSGNKNTGELGGTGNYGRCGASLLGTHSLGFWKLCTLFFWFNNIQLSSLDQQPSNSGESGEEM